MTLENKRKSLSFLKGYNNEKEGQLIFFKNYKQYIKSLKDKELEEILIQNTDGLFGGNILEFKLSISDINKTLFQVIKYLSKCRVNGISIPANILLISLNNSLVYKFDSQDFLQQIQEVYIGAASINNQNFNTNIKAEIINYSNTLGNVRLIELLREEKYTRININEDCILGWAMRYYLEKPNATKGSFLGTKNHDLFPNDGEIRNPEHFKDFIIPYKEKDNERFKYLMDTLNDKLSKKELGAFYTPTPYCKLAVEMVREAIKLVPNGNDYVIIDRCAGTGNLEEFLTEEELSHCILSTYEYYEYKVLLARLGSKVKFIIPPHDDDAIFKDGRIVNADAMSKEYIENEYLQSIINNPKIIIIMLENPPYRDSNQEHTEGKNSEKVNTYIQKEMRNDKLGNEARDLSNQFIWSAFKYYLRQPTDSYILFSPVKYFKSIHIVNKLFKDGYLLNRRHFHATASSISLIHWQNVDEKKEEFNLKAYDIELKKENGLNLQEQTNEGQLKYEKDVLIKKVYKTLDYFADTRYFDNDKITNVFCEFDGRERINKNSEGKSYFNENILCYLRVKGFSCDSKTYQLTRLKNYINRGFYLRSDNYLEKLPLFCAKLYPQENWYERDIYFTTADGGFEYLKDKDFLKACFIFTCLSQRNKCISFIGSDGRFYKNELCFDLETVTTEHLKILNLKTEDKDLLNLWQEVFEEAKNTKEYKQNLKYGTYQIIQELNTFYLDDKKNKIYNYPILNTKINSLKTKLKLYYSIQIQDKLFKYQLLK